MHHKLIHSARVLSLHTGHGYPRIGINPSLFSAGLKNIFFYFFILSGVSRLRLKLSHTLGFFAVRISYLVYTLYKKSLTSICKGFFV